MPFEAPVLADKATPVLTTLEMFDVGSGSTANGKIDRVVATFSENLDTPYSAGNTPLTLANVPSSGALNTVTNVSGTTARLNITEGAGAADTAVGSFTVALATNASGIRDNAGNLSSFAMQAPADKAGPVPVSITDTDGATNGLIDSGDSLIVTFSEPIASAVGLVTIITEADPTGGGNDTLNITGLTNGARNTGSNAYVNNNNRTFQYTNSTLTKSYGDKTITATVSGACSGDCADRGTNLVAANFDFAAALSLTDAAGNLATGSLIVSITLF